MEKVFDVIVAGASIAGATAAGMLSREGFSVLLVDESEFPRHKVCGEGLMPAGLEWLRRAGIPADALRSSFPFYGLRFSLQSGESLDLNFGDLAGNSPLPLSPPQEESGNSGPEPGNGAVGRVVPRREFDLALLQWASADGNLTLRTGNGIVAVEGCAGGIRVKSRKGESWRGRMLLAAAGVRSTFLHSLGVRSVHPRPKRFALQARMINRGQPLDRVEICCSEIGEAYLAPFAGAEVRVTLLLFSNRFFARGGARASFQKALKEFAGLRERLTPLEDGRPVHSWAPLGLSVSRVCGNRFLLIGDCAGAVDPISGQGMIVALRDAVTACRIAESGLSRDRLSAADLSEYSRERKSYFEPAAEAARLLLFVLHRPFLARRAFRLLRSDGLLKRKVLTIALHSPDANHLSRVDKLRLLAGF